MSDFEVTMGTGTLGVDLVKRLERARLKEIVMTYDTLRDTLAGKVSEGVDEVKVLEEQGAVEADALSGVGLGDGGTVGGGEDSPIFGLDGFLRRHCRESAGVV